MTINDSIHGIDDLGRSSGSAIHHDKTQPPPKKRHIQEPIAIIGIGCRLPGNSNSPHALWEFLERGGIADTVPPASRFRLDAHHDGSDKPKTMRSPGGMFIEGVDPKRFDAAFFGISKVDAIAMDPQQRQLLEVVYECLENAGITLGQLDGEAVGCFVGSYAVDYADMQARDPDDRVHSVTIGTGRAILSNRISHFLNIHGPSMTIDTACSGSLVGLDVACRYLDSGEVSSALVAGANLYLSPEHTQDSGPMRNASSFTGRCHTFDKKADGYIKAEAINCVMLKRLSDARRDGDPIRGIIRGTATNSDGKTPGIASPNSKAQAMAIRSAYANAGITDLTATSYIEMHGTGTQAGDPEEVKGVASVFAALRPIDSPLIIGSIKSNIGHSEPAAGVSGLIKAVLAVEKGRIPGNPTFIDPNPNIDFKGCRVTATRYTIPWPEPAFRSTSNSHKEFALRRAGINSFGYGGSNAHAIIEQVPEDMKKFTSSFGQGMDDLFSDTEDVTSISRPHVLLFSANDEDSIKSYINSLRKHLLNPMVSVDVPDLAYTLSERRTRHFHRGYIVTRDLALEPDSIVYGKQKSQSPRVGFIFTGQGAQWPQMGRSLVENFSEARDTIERLDRILRGLLHPPTWSLMQELTDERTPAKLREPEFSQPLVTALQIAIVSVLRKWGVNAEAVVGHSSGEIAAAYTAGLLSEENAIKAAYYRGYAAKKMSARKVEDEMNSEATDSAVGMMAVGLGAEQVQPYIVSRDIDANVSIACFNSPDSVTLSGTTKSLEAVRTALVADGHFARMLQVNMAYHSPFMADAGEEYVKCLEAEAFSTITTARNVSDDKPEGIQTKMFSSVEGDYTARPVDIAYWKRNMVQPVLFSQALQKMLSRKDSPDFLIEIGPSGALAGPTNQVKNSLPGGGADVQYCSAMTRGKDAEHAIFDVAGRLFVAGHTAIDFTAVNNLNNQIAPSPRFIADLPNYAWNHNTEYWYESEASYDWRFRSFPQHDLLGSKVLGTAWQAPTFKKSLKLDDLPWLRDHRLGPEIVFPGAGYMCMAIEAMMQTDAMLRADDAQGGPAPPSRGSEYQVRLRNVSFDRALVLEEGKETRLMLTLAPFAGQKDGWYFWVVRSLVQGSWTDHCKGQVRMEKDIKIVATSSEMAPLQHPTAGALWYKSLSDVGYNFGKSFQKLQLAEATSGSRKCRTQIDLTPPPSAYSQSEYPMHPAAFDGCMQSCAPGLWNGVKSSINTVLVPAMIDDVVIRTGRHHGLGLSVSESVFAGPGRTGMAKNYSSSAKVYDPNTGMLIFKLTGLRYHMLDFQDTPYASHHYSRLIWAPDLTLSPQACAINSQRREWDKVQEMVDLFAHKKPNAKVVEASLIPGDSSSVWLEGMVGSSRSNARKAFSSYNLLTSDATAAVATQSRYEAIPRTAFQLLNMAQALSVSEDETLKDVDLVILRLPQSSSHSSIDTTVMENVRNMLRDDGHVLVLQQYGPWETDSASSNDKVGTSGVDGYDLNGVTTNVTPCEVSEVKSNNCPSLKVLYTLDCTGSPSLSHGYFAKIIPASRPDESQPSTASSLDIIHISQPGPICSKISKALVGLGWDIQEIEIATAGSTGLNKIRKDATVLVLSELDIPQLPTLSTVQWNCIQQLLQVQNRVMWVSKSAQWKVKNPDGAMIHGLCRSIRSEDPSMTITTLDLEDPTNDAAVPTIDLLLRSVANQDASTARMGGFEGEYVERQGILHISRILGDDAINSTERAMTSGAQPVNMCLHEAHTTIRLIAERVGTIDSLQYVEVDSEELPMLDNTVEVELYASALNFKDVAVTMGLVPENHHLLGLEGSGIIRRTGNNLNSPFNVGQRVMILEKGTFANRAIVSTERTIAIPDWLSYEEAATLPSVYLTSLYSLFNLASIKKGDRVLIHSATGGLGLASIQICHSVGAEVYATVGQEVKKQFLVENFGIPEDHIFNSRTIEFHQHIMEQTGGYGVDIILNSLTGELLDASWRTIAECGTMVELGKKDILDRNTLSMEPFARNASYRSLDMSHKCVTDQVNSELMKQLMELIASRKVKPISPMKIFPYSDIPSAFRFMRSANHIGKIVISNKDLKRADPTVSVRPCPRKFRLRGDVSYLIVGGLRGLCGSLALDMARHGARNIVIMGRSGYDDPRSQSVLKDLTAEGCHADLVRGDVAIIDDVRRAFQFATKPIGGVIQGAMVLRDKPFEIMTHEDYHGAITAKVAGTWNLHNVALETNHTLDFFTMLSSVSGLTGQPGQANYAAANVFLDSFAHYRRGLGLKANSVNLGAIEDVGYVAERDELGTALNISAWTPINENLLHKILHFSIMQQEDSPINTASEAQLITSIAVPQTPSSRLIADARFSSLLFGNSAGGAGDSDTSGALNKEIQALRLMLKSSADANVAAAAIPVAVEVVNKQFMTILRLDEPLEPSRNLSAYGLDSLAAVEFRNWSRAQLGAELTTLDVTSAPSLLSLAEKIVIKIQAASATA
ncbi:Lovastatin diketide synthase LovF [Cytospora mali]|uniref:Lovastatin diketide synthase LovF n=1 Tax=Cytospora mali TaxID=578113 RepID=A0A194VS85_CYTMA|nr:Lovastatin diketide synthase LovF [Valsa mali]